MGKYGIGARVRDEDGDEGVIVDKRKGERRVRFEWDDSPSVTMWLAKSELTVIEAANDNAAAAEQWVPKVGDRVLAEGRGWGDTKNIGFVTKVVGEDAIVEFGDGWSDGHAEGEVDGASNRWFFSKNKIEPAPLTIEAGRYYKTRDGRKVGPMEWAENPVGDFTWLGFDPKAGFPRQYREDGSWALRKEDQSNLDLIAEWVDEPVVAVEEVAVAEATATVKAGDRVRRIASQVPAVCPVGFETNITKVDGQLIWYIDVDGDETSSTAGHGVWELIEPAAPKTETPATKFKVGDKVVVKADSARAIATVRTRNADGKMSISFDELGGEPGIEWWSDDELELVAEPSKSDTITLTLKVDSEPLADAFRTIAAALNRAADDISAA